MRLGFGELVVIVAVLAIYGVPLFFFLRTWSSTLRLTQPHHRYAPSMPWWMLLPGFNLALGPFLVNETAKGVRGKYKELGVDPGSGGLWIGMLWTLCLPVSVVASFFRSDSIDLPTKVYALTGLLALLGWAAYWVRLGMFNRRLRAASTGIGGPSVGTPTAVA